MKKITTTLFPVKASFQEKRVLVSDRQARRLHKKPVSPEVLLIKVKAAVST